MLLKTSGPFSEFHKASAPEPSGTSRGLCTGAFRNLTSYLPRNPPEPHRTLRSLSRYLHRNPPEPHGVFAPEPSGTSRGICTRTLQNLVRNLVLKLHRIAPELIWAKDPIAKFCCWGKTNFGGNLCTGWSFRFSIIYSDQPAWK